MKVTANGNHGLNTQRANTSKKIVNQGKRRSKQQAGSRNIDGALKHTARTQQFNAWRKTACAFKQRRLRRIFLGMRARKHRNRRKSIHLNLRHAMLNAEVARL